MVKLFKKKIIKNYSKNIKKIKKFIKYKITIIKTISKIKIQKIWSNISYITFILFPFSILYIIFIKTKKLLYKNKILSQWKSPSPIIIIGNITVGGSGKTPFVIWITQQLSSIGYKVGIISRGYLKKSKSSPIIVTKNISINKIGDEACLIYKNTKVPIVVSPNRIKAIKTLLKFKKIDVIISDDGLQHTQLKRDYEIVLIDGINRFGNNFLLPAGPLRECKKKLKKVNLIITKDGIPKKNEIPITLKGNIAINMLTKKKNIKIKKSSCYCRNSFSKKFFFKIKKRKNKINKNI